MTFKVTALAIDDKNSGKVTLESHDERTIYTSMIFIHVPIAELPLYPFGRELELELPQAAKPELVGGMPRSDWKHFETAHLEAGTGVND
jgi:hypothetical protein